jgi:hypothetical protein
VNVSAVATVEFAAATPEVAARPIANDDAGADVTRATTAIVSPVTVPVGKAKVTVIALVSPARRPVVPSKEIEVGARRVAFAGATVAIRPNPKAETTTSAMRLRVVFVDICFLSIKVDPRAFPESAWQSEEPFTS